MKVRAMWRWPALGLAAWALVACRAPVSFTVTPASFMECHGSSAAVKVRWYVPEGATRSLALPLNLYVNTLGRPEKLWATVPASGEKMTGAWMGDGFSVVLRDANGRFLARRTVTAQMPRNARGDLIRPAQAPECK